MNTTPEGNDKCNEEWSTEPRIEIPAVLHQEPVAALGRNEQEETKMKV